MTTETTRTENTATEHAGLEIRKGTNHKGQRRFEVYRDGQVVNTFLSLTTATKFIEKLKAQENASR